MSDPKPLPHFALTVQDAPKRGGVPKSMQPKHVRAEQIPLLPEAFHRQEQLTIDPRELKRREAAEAARIARGKTMGLFK